MKNFKRTLSLITALAIIVVMFAVSAAPVYADSGDVFTVNAVPDGWRFYTSSCVDRENSGEQFGVKANKGKGLDNYGVLLANALSTEVVKPSTTYRISFNIYTWYSISALQADVDTGTALWSRTNKVTTFTTLADYVTASSGGGDVRYSYDVSLDVTTPSTISGNQHFVLGIITKDGSTTTTANLRFRNITITEANNYSVIDAATGESMGSIGAFLGMDTASLIAGSAFDKDGFVFETSPATIADDTEAIVVTYFAKREINVYNAENGKLLGTIPVIDGDDAYALIGASVYNIEGFSFEVEPEFVESDTEALYVTYSEAPVQLIYFDDKYRGNPASANYLTWQMITTDGNSTLEISEDKLKPRVWETGGVKMTSKTDFSNRAFVMANSCYDSHMKAGGTYRVIMKVTIDSQYWTINDLNADIKFGRNVWNDLSGDFTLTGEDLAGFVIDTNANGTVIDYILSMNITIPEDAYNNIVMSLYGFVDTVDAETGQAKTSGVFYTVDDIEIWNTFDIAVEDQNGVSLGTVKARVGDSVERAAKDYLGEHDGFVYTVTTNTVESLDEPIILNKAEPAACEHENTHVVEAVVSTCHKPGHGAYTVCDDCGEIIEGSAAELPLDPANHEGETEVRGETDSTCAVAGYTGDTYCLGCGEKIAEGEAKPFAAHTAGEWIKDEINHWHICTVCQSKVDEAAHTAGEWIVDTPATTEAAGSRHKECTVCGYITETEDIPQLASYIPGDINNDGKVNNKDLTRLFQYLSDWDVEVNTSALDVNGDGNVNNKDLTRLFQYLSDWDVEIY